METAYFAAHGRCLYYIIPAKSHTQVLQQHYGTCKHAVASQAGALGAVVLEVWYCVLKWHDRHGILLKTDARHRLTWQHDGHHIYPKMAYRTIYVQPPFSKSIALAAADPSLNTRYVMPVRGAAFRAKELAVRVRNIWLTYQAGPPDASLNLNASFLS